MVGPHFAQRSVLTSTQSTSPYKDDYSQPNILGDVKVPVYSTTLSQCPSSKKAGLYLVCTKEVDLGKAPVVKILEKIQEETANWLKKLGGANFEVDNVWRRREETQFTGQDMRFTEKDMMDCVLEAASTLPWCVLDEPGMSVPFVRNHSNYAERSFSHAQVEKSPRMRRPPPWR